MLRVDVRGTAVTKLLDLPKDTRGGILEHLVRLAKAYSPGTRNEVEREMPMWTESGGYRLYCCVDVRENLLLLEDFVAQDRARR